MVPERVGATDLRLSYAVDAGRHLVMVTATKIPAPSADRQYEAGRHRHAAAATDRSCTRQIDVRTASGTGYGANESIREERALEWAGSKPKGARLRNRERGKIAARMNKDALTQGKAQAHRDES